MAVPKFDELLSPLFQAMHALGGSASIAEQEDAVATMLHLTEKDVAEIHRGNRTKFSYRLAWARTYLKRFGLIENSARGVWSLTAEGIKLKAIDKEKVRKAVQAQDRRKEVVNSESIIEVETAQETWQDELLRVIKRELSI